MKGSNLVVIVNLCMFRCVITTSLACESLATLSCDVPLHRKIFVRLKKPVPISSIDKPYLIINHLLCSRADNYFCTIVAFPMVLF